MRSDLESVTPVFKSALCCLQPVIFSALPFLVCKGHNSLLEGKLHEGRHPVSLVCSCKPKARACKHLSQGNPSVSACWMEDWMKDTVHVKCLE